MAPLKEYENYWGKCVICFASIEQKLQMQIQNTRHSPVKGITKRCVHDFTRQISERGSWPRVINSIEKTIRINDGRKRYTTSNTNSGVLSA